MSDKLRECPCCGHTDLLFSIVDYNTKNGHTGCRGCGISVVASTHTAANRKWNTRHEPKHEKVSEWEARTGAIYPDDGPVWVEYRILKEDRIEWKLCILKDIKQWDHIASKYNIETSEISIVANHHGKPETE